MKINRRALMGWMGMSGGAALGMQLLSAGKSVAGESMLEARVADISAIQTSPTRWERSAQHKRELTKDVIWLTQEPLDFILRRGNHSDNEPERYRRMYDPDNLKRMADAGVVFGRIIFYKGLGPQYEKPDMELAKRTAEAMHRLGMKVSLYIGGTMFTESLYRELPEAKSWEQRDCWNHWVSYGMQTYRHYACVNHPGYEDYLRPIVKIGVQDVGADEIAFDQIMLQPEPRSCRCQRCIEAFKAFLRKRYPTSEAARRRFGLPDVTWIRVNQWESTEQPEELAVLDDPVLQEWARFRCEFLAEHGVNLYNYVKSLNQNVAVSYNMKGLFCFNRYWANAVYHPLFTGHVDRIMFDTSGYDAGIDPVTGALVSQIRSYKVARQIGASSEERVEERLQDDLLAAVYMAFGYQKPICVPAPSGRGAYNVFTPIMEFFREYNNRYFTQTELVADVAVLHNWPSMAYSISANWALTTLMEQVLIQYKVPFDLLFDEQFDRIGSYAAVILAGQECISNAQAALLMRYVHDGGTLLISGKAGQFNEWREQRAVNLLPPSGRQGKGRIVHIPEISFAKEHKAKSSKFEDPEPGATRHKGIRISPAQWVLPKNHEAIYKSIVSALPAGFSIKAEAPLTTVMELLNRPGTQETIIHFINFDRQNRTAPFAVTLRKQFSGSAKSVTCRMPEVESPAKLSFKESGSFVNFTVPALRLYTMIVVEQ